MERCLGLKFELETAPSGPAALAKLQDGAPFPVVVTDMRMPSMDGVQFIAEARKLSKHSVFVMLTGNQDVQTAVRAVNEGHVFRFLNKPCDPAEITATIQHAFRQHQLEASERELLNQTFLGTLAIFADVIETLEPELMGRAGKTEQVVEALRTECGIDPRWEYKVAAKLLLLGYAMHATRTKESQAAPAEVVAALGRACSTAAKLVQRVPRLGAVAEIIRCVPAVDGSLGGDAATAGATLLRVAHHVESFAVRGVPAARAVDRLRELLPSLDDRLARGALAVYPRDVESEGVAVDVDDLRPGMVLYENLTRPDGATLLRAGRVLSATHIDKLKLEKECAGDHPPVLVTRESFVEAHPELEVESLA